MESGLIGPEARDAVERAWVTYVDTVEPLRGDLYRYCRRLAASVWDAEDLVQDTLLRAFGSIARRDEQREYGAVPGDVRNARAYLFRIASNLWIDSVRRTRPQAAIPESSATAGNAPDARLRTGEAASRLVASASPQERAALLLKDVFDFSLDEIAEMLTTTPGAVKSALHRARANLKHEPEDGRAGGGAAVEVVDRFVAAFNARDVAALTALLLETVSIDVIGDGGERGRKANWIRFSFDGHGGQLQDWHWAERRMLDGDAICVHLHRAGGAETLEDVTRLETHDGRVTRLRSYCFCPQTLEEAASRLGLPFVTHGYRWRSEPATQPAP
jgi:RNA polymerase sigma-70 factor (ECF subfamily)